MYEIEQNNKPEKAILIGVDLGKDAGWDEEQSLNELALLVDSAGGEVADKMMQRRKQLDPAHYVGQGFAESIKETVEVLDADIVIFDDELSPAQVKNLERVIGKLVIDRSQLILDIFAQRARSTEAKIQVELAQLQYLLPRLTRMWEHLSRIRGGIGLRGPGETQLEVDRRLIRTRIGSLKRQLKILVKRRHTQREKRTELFNVALVGYTNSGKSTVLNQLSGSDIHVENRLFATLDATTRRVQLDESHTMLLTDTVGFIRKLPHDLVASFRATLEEVIEADLLIHLIDIGDPYFEDHMEVVNNVLYDLGVVDKKKLLVFNKKDKVNEEGIIPRVESIYPDAILISAISSEGIDFLRNKLLEELHAREMVVEISLPHSEGKLLAELYALGKVLSKNYLDGTIQVQIRLERTVKEKLEKRGIVMVQKG